MQNRHKAIQPMQTYFSSEDILCSRAAGAAQARQTIGDARLALVATTLEFEQDRASVKTIYGGAERDRTADPLLAKQVLSQLSYSPNS
jgi:hypothetical protein